MKTLYKSAPVALLAVFTLPGASVFATDEVVINSPLSAVTVREPRDDADGSFELFAAEAVFSAKGRKDVRIPAGARNFPVYSGFVDYCEDPEGRLQFIYYGPKENLALLVQGRRFAIGRGGRLTARRSDAGTWMYSTVGSISDHAKVRELVLLPEPAGGQLPTFLAAGGDLIVTAPFGGAPVPALKPADRISLGAPGGESVSVAALAMAEPASGAVVSGAVVSGSVSGAGDTEEKVLGVVKDGVFLLGAKPRAPEEIKAAEAAKAVSGEGPVQASKEVTVVELRKRLYALPKEEIILRQMTLKDSFGLLARKAGISFMYVEGADKGRHAGSGDTAPDDSGKITVRAVDTPFRLLELLAFERGCVVQPLGVTPEFPDGIWTLKNMENEGLIARTYRLKYAYGSASGSGLSGTGGGLGGSGSGGRGRGIKPGHAKQFSSDGSQLMSEVKSLLEITERGLVIDGETDFHKTDAELHRQLAERGGVPSVRNVKYEGPKAQVLFNDVTGVMFVAATRQQHEWVRAYLRAIDRPSRNIFLEIKFVETSKSPTENYGIKWPMEFNVGVSGRNTISAARGVSGAGGAAGGSLWQPGTGLPGYEQSGVGIPIPDGFPLVGLLKAESLNFVLSALKEDSQGSNIQYFYTMVSENREVLMKNTSQEPVLMANSQVSAGSSTTTQEVEYRDIGMILNVKPRIVGVSDIHMDLSFELSKIISQRTINGNQYPVPGVRSYEAPVTVSSGDSLAIGGLDEFTQNTGVSKVPILGDIPLLGKLFQHKAKSKPQAHLLIFVTARIQDDYARGVDRQRARHLPW